MPRKPVAGRLVILPSFNSGSLLVQTARAVLETGAPVWVVLDGSTDTSVREIQELSASVPGLKVITLEKNHGKGGAALIAMEAASRAGYTHALIMDADGQHPAASIPEFFALSERDPAAMILGVPVFGPDAPAERVKGRRVGNGFTHLETLWGGIEDSLFGFRLYPLEPALAIMHSIASARRFDFDTELAVRMFWSGIRPINRPVPVTYPPRQDGGVTHFRYLRDNLLLARTHARLCVLLLPRLWRVWKLRRKWLSQNDNS
ncbi:MAG TPA: glycosyltransferase family 2 protein [Terrimicrobiaceae bacterium]|nr:glycosyltransferase family 2 protein [Terrimicrobiaceae bacterium]